MDKAIIDPMCWAEGVAIFTQRSEKSKKIYITLPVMERSARAIDDQDQEEAYG